MNRPVVLIADDEPIIVAALKRLGEEQGLTVVTDTSSDVYRLAKQHRPAVIILDLRQSIDGRDLLARLKRDPETSHIKVVVLSAIEDQFIRHTCLELGAHDYAVKPIEPLFMSKIARLAREVAG